MADFEGDGAPVRVNRGARAGWLIGLLIGVVVVFGVLGIVLRETLSNAQAYKVGHEHEHHEQGGEAPAAPTPPPGKAAGGMGAAAAHPEGDHAEGDGHDHAH